MNRIVLALLMLLIGSRVAEAESITVQRGDIVSHGIYAVDQSPQGRNAEGVLQSHVNNVKLAVTTETVAAQLGSHFGFQYRVVGAPEGAQVEIRSVVIFPAAGIHPPGKKPVHRYVSTSNQVIGGAPGFAWYAFDDPWELVPGNWMFEVWYGDRKLATQSFKVVMP